MCLAQALSMGFVERLLSHTAHDRVGEVVMMGGNRTLSDGVRHRPQSLRGRYGPRRTLNGFWNRRRTQQGRVALHRGDPLGVSRGST
jgi:hypothetical protein